VGILDFLFGKKIEETKSESSTEQPSASLKKEAFDWRTNEAHLLLLSRFLYAQKAKGDVSSNWENVLGEPLQRALDRFISEGWLVPASLSSKLDRAFNSTEIKKLLKERSLPVSGRKEQGIERLVKKDPEGMSGKVTHLDLLQCSPEARAIAEQFIAKHKAEREVAEAKSLDQLRLGDFQNAILTVAQFETKQVFPRGLGIDWTKPQVDSNVELLKAIFENHPKILAGLSETEWEPLRVATAMMHLWGTNKATKWLPTNFIGTPKFDHDTTARMVLFHGQHRRNMTDYLGKWEDLRIKKIEILGSSDSCPQCKKIAGKTYSIEKVPELPYEKCTHEMGCRCLAEPVI
jgi:hypothetical protein